MRAITLSLKAIRHDAIASKMLAPLIASTLLASAPAAGGVDAWLLQPPLAAMARSCHRLITLSSVTATAAQIGIDT